MAMFTYSFKHFDLLQLQRLQPSPSLMHLALFLDARERKTELINNLPNVRTERNVTYLFRLGLAWYNSSTMLVFCGVRVLPSYGTICGSQNVTLIQTHGLHSVKTIRCRTYCISSLSLLLIVFHLGINFSSNRC